MSIMDSISSFFNKAADKLVPKEITGVGSFATPWFGPGYAQLWQAMMDSKKRGEVDLTNQAITAATSLANMPQNRGFTSREMDFAKKNPDFLKGTSGAGVGASYSPGVMRPSFAGGLQRGANIPATLADASKLTAAEQIALRQNPDFIKAFKGASGLESTNALKDFAMTAARPMGDAFSSLKQGDITFGNLYKGLGTSAAMSFNTEMKLEKLKEKAARAKRAGDIEGYQAAMAAVQAAIARFSDPTNKYGNYPGFMANQGGLARTGYEHGAVVGGELLSPINSHLPITRTSYNMGGLGSIPQTPMVPQGQQLDGRGGGFLPMGVQEGKDDVPAMLAKNEFVMTSDAVRAAGGGSVEKGAQRMYDVMNQLEAQV